MKKKLFASMLSLAMAFILLTSSSFAWFSIATQGEIDAVEVSMGGTDILEIQLDGGEPNETTDDDAGNYYQYGDFVQYEAAADGLAIDLPSIYSGGTLATVGYDDHMRTDGITDSASAGDLEDSIKTYTTAGGKVLGYGLCGYIRTNVAGDVDVAVTADGLGWTLVVGSGDEKKELSANGSFDIDAVGGVGEHIPYELLVYVEGSELHTPDTTGGGSISLLFTNGASSTAE